MVANAVILTRECKTAALKNRRPETQVMDEFITRKTKRTN